jgi:hypothetical protein
MPSISLALDCISFVFPKSGGDFQAFVSSKISSPMHPKGDEYILRSHHHVTWMADALGLVSEDVGKVD